MTTCKICNSQTEHWAELHLFHCGSCGHSESSAKIENPYKNNKRFSEYYSTIDSSLGGKAISMFRLGILQAHGNLGGKIVDLGCSVGSFLSLAKEYGYETLGVDCDPWALTIAELNGVPIIKSDIDRINGELPMADCFCLFDVIEHIEYPSYVLSKIKENLRQPGALIVSTPDSTGVDRKGFRGFRHYKPDEHFHYFTRQSLKVLLGSCGFRVVSESALESEIRINPERRKNNIVTMLADIGG